MSFQIQLSPGKMLHKGNFMFYAHTDFEKLEGTLTTEMSEYTYTQPYAHIQAHTYAHIHAHAHTQPYVKMGGKD